MSLIGGDHNFMTSLSRSSQDNNLRQKFLETYQTFMKLWCCVSIGLTKHTPSPNPNFAIHLVGGVWILVELHTERESPISCSLFSCASSVLVELELEFIVFVGGGKLENLEKNPHSKARPNKVGLHSQGCNQPQAPLGSKRSHQGVIPVPPKSGILYI